MPVAITTSSATDLTVTINGKVVGDSDEHFDPRSLPPLNDIVEGSGETSEILPNERERLHSTPTR